MEEKVKNYEAEERTKRKKVLLLFVFMIIHLFFRKQEQTFSS
jgi:hypothetical protein